MMDHTVFERGVIRTGNNNRIKKVMERAVNGEKLTIGFLGGSITQGSLSSVPQTCYAYLVFEWWKKTFPKAEFTYVNAGIGGTSSQLGVSRVDKDLLAYEPDFCIVEFTVNDEDNEFFLETYEGLLRKILLYGNGQTAVMLLHNVQYDDGKSAFAQHNKAGEFYQLPACGINDSIYREIKEGRLKTDAVTPDMLHPNDTGHALLAEQVTTLLELIRKATPDEEHTIPERTLTLNRFQKAGRLQNMNCIPEICGFAADTEPQRHITEFFRNGWTAEKTGDRIVFELECSCLAVQYRKTISKPAPAATAVLDGNTEQSVLLDGEFDQTWGDCLFCQTLFTETERKKHTLEITITRNNEEDRLPFYLVSLLYA